MRIYWIDEDGQPLDLPWGDWPDAIDEVVVAIDNLDRSTWRLVNALVAPYHLDKSNTSLPPEQALDEHEIAMNRARVVVEASRFAIERASKSPGPAMTRLWRHVDGFWKVRGPMWEYCELHDYAPDLQPLGRETWETSGFRAASNAWKRDRDTIRTLDRPITCKDKGEVSALVKNERDAFEQWLTETVRSGNTAEAYAHYEGALRHHFISERDPGFSWLLPGLDVSRVGREIQLYAVLWRHLGSGAAHWMNYAFERLRQKVIGGLDWAESVVNQSATPRSWLDEAAGELWDDAIPMGKAVLVVFDTLLEALQKQARPALPDTGHPANDAMMKPVAGAHRVLADAVSACEARVKDAQAEASPSMPAPVEVAKPAGGGKLPGMSWEEAVRKAEAIVRAEGWQGIKPLARRIGCSDKTLRKAVSGSVFLSARKAEHEKQARSGSSVRLAGQINPERPLEIATSPLDTDAIHAGLDSNAELIRLIAESNADNARHPSPMTATPRRPPARRRSG